MDMDKKQVYYLLPLDSYNQPNGNVNEVMLTKVEYEKMKEYGYYVYDNYANALWRAQA